MEVEGQYKLSDTTWIDEVAEVMRTRELTIVNSYIQEGVSTSNKSIMDWAVQYVKQNNLDTNLILPINYIRQYKRMYLPCELAGMKENCEIKEFREIESKSCIAWKFKFEEVPKPSKKTKDIWKSFIQQIKDQQISTINDFDHQVECMFQITTDEKYLKRNGLQPKIYQKEESYGRPVYVEIELV